MDYAAWGSESCEPVHASSLALRVRTSTLMGRAPADPARPLRGARRALGQPTTRKIKKAFRASGPRASPRCQYPRTRRRRRSSSRPPRPTRSCRIPERRATYDRYGHEGLRSGWLLSPTSISSARWAISSRCSSARAAGLAGCSPAPPAVRRRAPDVTAPKLRSSTLGQAAPGAPFAVTYEAVQALRTTATATAR